MTRPPRGRPYRPHPGAAAVAGAVVVLGVVGLAHHWLARSGALPPWLAAVVAVLALAAAVAVFGARAVRTAASLLRGRSP